MAQIGETPEVGNTEGKALFFVIPSIIYGGIFIRKITHHEFVDRLKLISPNIEITTTYVNSDTKVHCVCKDCGYEWDALPYNLSAGKNCKQCYFKRESLERIKPLDDVMEDIKKVNSNIELCGNYTGINKKTDFKCLIHDKKFRSTPKHILRGQTGCKECIRIKNHNSGLKSNAQFISDLRQTNKYVDVIGNYINSTSPIKVKCKVCGEVWNPVASSLLAGVGCPNCKKSKGERLIKQYLDDNQIVYEEQKKFEDLKGDSSRPLPLSYDFYIPTYNLLIEYQGQFHDGTASFVDKNSYYEKQVHNDNKKRVYASSNGYALLEIWYYDIRNINKILDEYLQKIKNPVTTTAV